MKSVTQMIQEIWISVQINQVLVYILILAADHFIGLNTNKSEQNCIIPEEVRDAYHHLETTINQRKWTNRSEGRASFPRRSGRSIPVNCPPTVCWSIYIPADSR